VPTDGELRSRVCFAGNLSPAIICYHLQGSPELVRLAAVLPPATICYHLRLPAAASACAFGSWPTTCYHLLPFAATVQTGAFGW
jgi:hypothetical protein